MNDYLIYEWFEKMGHYSVRRRYVELFLHSAPGRLTMGDYHGVYVLVEKIRVDSNRVDIAGTDTLGQRAAGGDRRLHFLQGQDRGHGPHLHHHQRRAVDCLSPRRQHHDTSPI